MFAQALFRRTIFRPSVYVLHECTLHVIQRAKGPFASNSISMNVVLSSNAAYWDQFSGREYDFPLLERKIDREREAKRKKKTISYSALSARCTQSQIRSSIRGEYVVFGNVLPSLLATIFPAASRKTDIDNALPLRCVSLYLGQLSSTVLHAIIRRKARPISREILD